MAPTVILPRSALALDREVVPACSHRSKVEMAREKRKRALSEATRAEYGKLLGRKLKKWFEADPDNPSFKARFFEGEVRQREQGACRVARLRALSPVSVCESCVLPPADGGARFDESGAAAAPRTLLAPRRCTGRTSLLQQLGGG